MKSLRDHWTLDPEITFLNHGSFGACPKPVIRAQRLFQDRLERQPMHFMLHELPRLLEAVREEVALFVGADPDGLVFVTNASTAINTVLRGLDLRPGDALLTTQHAYQACRRTLEFVAARAGAEIQVAEVPFPGTTAEAAIAAITAAVTDRTRVALLDHISSQTAVVFPIAEVVAALEARGVPTLVDGAHAPGMLDLSVRDVGAAWYTGNLHKWCCAPKGAAFLHVRADHRRGLHPLVISHGYVPGGDLRAEFDWAGTWDPSAWLSVPTALATLEAMLPGGWPAVRAHNHGLCLSGRRIMVEALGIELPCPDALVGSMASLPIPDGASPPAPGLGGYDPDQARLYAEHGIEVSIIAWPESTRRLLRISAFLYNTEAEYRRLAATASALFGDRA